MLFLSQVLGEEEDEERREELIDALDQGVRLQRQGPDAQPAAGATSARRTATTSTKARPRSRRCRACAAAATPASSCRARSSTRRRNTSTTARIADGGISYSSRNRGSSRPAITAAALAALYNAGDYDSKHVPEMLEYCKKNLQNLSEGPNSFGHWHYTYLYYSQVMYRQGNKEWEPFRDKLYNQIVNEQQADGSWTGNIGPIYVTACNLIMLQLDKAYLPIYQR